MADINAIDLTAETLESLDGTENVVGFDTAEGKKIPISVLADYAIQKKTQTIAGATQTPQTALNSAYNLKANITTAITDLNTFTTPGVYYFNNNGTLENNFPVVNSGELIVENRINSSSYLRQTFYPANYPGRQYVRDYNNGTWASWTLMPTRAEMDTVNSRFELYSGNVDNLKTTKFCYVLNGTGATIPDGSAAFLGELISIFRETSGGAGKQIYTRYNSNDMYVRQFDGSAWTSWEKMPTRAEMDALNSKANFMRWALNAQDVSFPVTRTTWQNFIVIGNITGAGNVCAHVSLKSSGTTPVVTNLVNDMAGLDVVLDTNSISLYSSANHSYTWVYCLVIGIY